jgi:hypothetical protein
MSAVTTEIDTGLDPLSVKISWTAPTDNSDSITSYEILIREQGGSQFSATADCNGADSAVVAARFCLVPLTTLTAAPYSLVFGDLVAARARAINSIGAGQYSQPNAVGATIETAPVAMLTPTRGATTLTSVVVDWLALTGTDTRGSAIDSYELSYGAGVSGTTWTPLQGQTGAESTLLTHTLTGATPGEWYRFRVRAHNVHGWGAYSPTLDAQAAQEPAQPAAVTTALADASARISWVAPSSNHKTIVSYDIEIADAAGSSYFAELTHCDGGVGSAVVTQLYCDVPVSVLRAPPYSLLLQDLVVARVRASNELGAGAYSPDNTVGALIETEPAAMASPTRGSGTGPASIELQWALLTSPADGHSAVTTYELYWDAGAGSAAPW